MHVPVRVVKGIVPYIVIVKSSTDEWFLKGSKRKTAMFKTREDAEKRVLELSIKHPNWKYIIKLSNGVSL